MREEVRPPKNDCIEPTTGAKHVAKGPIVAKLGPKVVDRDVGADQVTSSCG